jgi:hypothetical protein
LETLSSATSAELEDFASRLINPSAGDPAATPVGKGLGSCS